MGRPNGEAKGRGQRRDQRGGQRRGQRRDQRGRQMERPNERPKKEAKGGSQRKLSQPLVYHATIKWHNRLHMKTLSQGGHDPMFP